MLRTLYILKIITYFLIFDLLANILKIFRICFQFKLITYFLFKLLILVARCLNLKLFKILFVHRDNPLNFYSAVWKCLFILMTQLIYINTDFIPVYNFWYILIFRMAVVVTTFHLLIFCLTSSCCKHSAKASGFNHELWLYCTNNVIFVHLFQINYILFVYYIFFLHIN